MNSNVFIFLFLPVILALYLIFPFRGVALVFSILFYLWLDPLYFPIILFIAVLNYFAARLLHKRPGRILMLISVGLNVLILFFFKSLEANLLDPISVGGLEFNRPPIGISFITFTTIAYLLDTYFQRIKIQPNFFAYLDFQMFFPKVLAGPITRYSTFQKGVVERLVLSNLAAGTRRFARGLIKKVLLADVLGQVVGPIFALPAGQRSMLLAWIGLLFYTLQIFFDFSGYTDMALGIGQMFGVNLPENFNYPYIAKSIGEFWRRWHITLSNWFRDYIFFPMERKFRGRKY